MSSTEDESADLPRDCAQCAAVGRLFMRQLCFISAKTGEFGNPRDKITPHPHPHADPAKNCKGAPDKKKPRLRGAKNQLISFWRSCAPVCSF